MKIQTQFRLLIAGILIVPLLLGSAQFVYRYVNEDRSEISAYEELAAMLDEEMNFEDRELFSRSVYRFSRIGDIVIFRNDFMVLHSTISGFTAGETASAEKIFSFISQQYRYYMYTFESPGWMNSKGYLLIQRKQPRRISGSPILYPNIMLFCLFLVLTVFAITMSLFIARSITKSVMVLENATKRIASGDLDLVVEAKGSNEITSLTNSLNKMRDALKEDERRRYRFIMGITHDLKTPLALIKAYTEAIEDGITEDPAAKTKATEIINAKVDRLEGMIGDLIEFVRMDTGEWRSQLKDINISSFLRQTAKAFMLDAELLHHEFRCNITLPDTISIPMDEGLVRRALENIVNNAIRYTPNGSVISLGAGLDGGAVRLTIRDNGPGIDPADLPHIFEMFYRGSSSRREQGMGLGLAVVKWVADCHGWSISASSEKGQGVCFTITIPKQTPG
jgi:signal transduction histidine kinase